MNQELLSNNSSVILRSLQDQETVDLSYKFKKSFPILATELRGIQANSGASVVNGGEIAFNIVKSNLLGHLTVQFTYAMSTAQGDTVKNEFPIGLMMSDVEIRSNNKILFTYKAEALQALVDTLPFEKKVDALAKARPLDPSTYAPFTATNNGVNSTANAVSFFDVPCSLFDQVQSYLDVGFYEQIQVVLKIRAKGDISLAHDFSNVNAVLYTYKYQPDMKAYQALLAKNQNPAQPLVMYVLDTFRQSEVCTDTTINTIRLTSNYPITDMYIGIMDNTGATTITSDDYMKNIEMVTFSLNGENIIDNVPKYAIDALCVKGMHTSSMGMLPTSQAITYSSNKWVHIPFGLDMMNQTYCSGALSLAQVNFPSVTVRTSAITAAENNLVVIVKYAKILSLDSSNGSISVAVNS